MTRELLHSSAVGADPSGEHLRFGALKKKLRQRVVLLGDVSLLRATARSVFDADCGQDQQEERRA